jgi:hypothetical protein
VNPQVSIQRQERSGYCTIKFRLKHRCYKECASNICKLISGGKEDTANAFPFTDNECHEDDFDETNEKPRQKKNVKEKEWESMLRK